MIDQPTAFRKKMEHDKALRALQEQKNGFAHQIGIPHVVHVAECRDPAIAQLVALLNDMSEKGRKQAGAILAVIHRFDKGSA